jgi:hypothetical protein
MHTSTQIIHALNPPCIFAIKTLGTKHVSEVGLGEQVYKIGTGDTCDIRFRNNGLPAKGVSPIHAVLVVSKTGVGFILPFDTTTPVRVDGQEIGPMTPWALPWTHPAVVRIGSLRFSVRYLHDKPLNPTLAAPTAPSPLTPVPPPLLPPTPQQQQISPAVSLWADPPISAPKFTLTPFSLEAGAVDPTPRHLAPGSYILGSSDSADITAKNSALRPLHLNIQLEEISGFAFVSLASDKCQAGLDGRPLSFGTRQIAHFPSVIDFGSNPLRIRLTKYDGYDPECSPSGTTSLPSDAAPPLRRPAKPLDRSSSTPLASSAQSVKVRFRIGPPAAAPLPVRYPGGVVIRQAPASPPRVVLKRSAPDFPSAAPDIRRLKFTPPPLFQ